MTFLRTLFYFIKFGIPALWSESPKERSLRGAWDAAKIITRIEYKRSKHGKRKSD